MTAPSWNHIARYPRHQVETHNPIQAEIVRTVQNKPTVLPATLVNLSRKGAQFQLNQPLCQGESILLRIQAEDPTLAIEIAAIICWLRPEDTELWSFGIQFKEELAWESYGELFLQGVLESELPSIANAPSFIRP